MSPHRTFSWCLAATLVAQVTSTVAQDGPVFPAPDAAPQPAPQSVEAVAGDGVEVLTRGPVHEAFAETVSYDPKPGIVVPKAPPEAIEEIPPEQKPEGANVEWIPGYWAWDDERNDFLWISGIWRALPPGRQWIPGYWTEVEGGYQWTSGYWADSTADETEYLPEPPATLEVGPNVAAPSDDYVWTPGYWTWNQNRYAWQPGYWAAGYQNWVWVPPYYAWSPRGYTFVNGYWDYPLARRGLPFAPLYFNSNVYRRPGYFYSPSIALNALALTSQLFLRPGYQHYYFGDYYAPGYLNAGYYPYFAYHNRYGYDPFYAHQRWQNRGNRDWDRLVMSDFERRRDNENDRPPRTWDAQKALAARQGARAQANLAVAAPVAELAARTDGQTKFQAVDGDAKGRYAARSKQVNEFQRERRALESNARADAADRADVARDRSQRSETPRAKLPKSPVVAPSVDQLGAGQGPPKRHEVLRPNVDQQPRQRSEQPKNVDRSPGGRDRNPQAQQGKSRSQRPPGDNQKPKGSSKGGSSKGGSSSKGKPKGGD